MPATLPPLPLLRNFTSRFAGEGGVRVLSAVGFAVFARVMGPAGMGAYVAGLAFASFFVVLHEAGLHLILLREVARAPRRVATLIAQAGMLKAAVALGAVAVTPLAARVMGLPAEAAWLALCAALALNTGSFVEALGAALVGLERLDREAVLRITHRTATVLLPLAGWALTHSVAGVLLAQALGSLVTLVLGWRWLRQGAIGRFAPGWRGWSGHAGAWLAASWPVTLAGLCVALSARMDVVMLTRWRTVEEAGWYGAAQRFLELGMAVPSALGTVLLPSLTRLAGRATPAERLHAYARLLRLFILVALPAAVLLAGCSGLLVRVLCGEAFAPSAPLLVGLSPALALAFVNYLFAYTLVAAGRQRTFLAITAAATAANLAANAILVPQHGAGGAVGVRILTEVVTTAGGLAAFLALARGPGSAFLLRLAPAAAALIGVAVAFPVSPLGAVAATGAYAALGVLTGAIELPARRQLADSLARRNIPRR